MSGKEMKNDWLEIRASFQWNILAENMKKLALELEETKNQNQGNIFSQKRNYEGEKFSGSENADEKGEKTKQTTGGGHSVGGGRLLPLPASVSIDHPHQLVPGLVSPPASGAISKVQS